MAGRDSHVMIPGRREKVRLGGVGCARGADESLHHKPATEGIAFVVHCVFSSASEQGKRVSA